MKGSSNRDQTDEHAPPSISEKKSVNYAAAELAVWAQETSFIKDIRQSLSAADKTVTLE